MRPSQGIIQEFINRMKNKRIIKRLVLMMSVVVVFVTTYVLILPAFTLDYNEAADQAGIEMVSSDQEAAEAAQAELSEPDKEETSVLNDDTDTEMQDPEQEYTSEESVSEDKTIRTERLAGDDFFVSAVISADDDVPDDVTITAEELDRETKGFDYEYYVSKALDAINKGGDDNKDIETIKLYDISLESESLNETVEPSETVSLKITYNEGIELDGGDGISVIHFTEQNDGGIKANVLDEKKDNVETKLDSDSSRLTEVSFDTDSFSLFGVAVTSDKAVQESDDDLTEDTIAEDEPAVPVTKSLKAAQLNAAGAAVSGTLVQGQDILENGEYMIITQSGSHFYALTNIGGKVEVTYNSSTKTFTYTGSSPIAWDFEYVGHSGWEGHYLVTSLEDPQYYLDPGCESYNNLLARWFGRVTINKISSSSDAFYVYGDSGNKYLGWENNTSFGPVNNPNCSIFIAKVGSQPVKYNVTVTVDDSSHGTVSGTNNSGSNVSGVQSFVIQTSEAQDNGMADYDASAHPITAAEKSGYTFSHWELNGTWLSSDKTLNTTLHVSSDDSVLKAVYKEDTEISDDMTKSEIEEKLSAWASEMMSDKITTSKTAQVYDYGNRIYEVTMGASSGIKRVLPTIDLAFITDVSRSMYFPATLVKEGTFTQGTANDKSHDYGYGRTYTDSSLSDWLKTADTSKVYYVVADDSSATVTAIYYGGKSKNSADSTYDNQWRYVDASYFDAPDGEKKAGTVIKTSGTNDSSAHLLTGVIYTAADSLRRMDYLKMAAQAASNVLYGVDPSAQIGLVTFAADAYPENTGFYKNPGTGDNAFYDALTSVHLQGGTDQADGLVEAQNLFKDGSRTTNPTPKRVAILITDGAPNQNNRTDWTTVIGPAATNLKNLYGKDSVELYTLGLSMDMVGETNRNGLKSIATGGASGDHWFEASNGASIVAALESIIESIINEASLKGTITDAIDPAFYPVSKDGTPLKPGDMINLNGEKITSKPSDGKYGVITKTGDTFGVSWSNQVVGYSENGSSTWEGKFYVKAKEDFLGGNTINTNTGDNTFTPSKYIIDGMEYNLYTGDTDKLKRSFETPYVNVDELTLTQNSTEWTVYLGTSVDPSKQLKALADNILVKEVVSSSVDNMIQKSTDMLGSSKTDESDTFKLEDAIGGELTDAEWNKLMSGETVTRDYSAYGHDDVGTVTISLVKVGDTADFSEHDTSETGEGVEKYMLTVSYKPAAAEEINYHTTAGGSPGSPAETMRSSNNHQINVYAKKLKINKVDQGGRPITSPAEFTLYRRIADDSKSYISPSGLPEGKYMEVETLTTSDGSVTTAGSLNSAFEYYLVETSAPSGYKLLPGYIKVTVDKKDLFVQTLDPQKTSDTEWTPWVLSDWEQTSEVMMNGYEGAEGYAIYDEEAGEAYSYDTVTKTVEYRIMNYAGYELPHTGGIGTLPYTICGIVLIVSTALIYGFRMRRRERRSC